jgi:hypothetical protein
MNLNNALKITTIGALILISLSISYYFLQFLPKSQARRDSLITTLESNKKTVDRVGAILHCNQLFKIKESFYPGKFWRWGEGEGEVVYNPDLNNCFAVNLHNTPRKMGEYLASLIDMSDDTEIMGFSRTSVLSGGGYYFDENDQKVQCKDNYYLLEFIENGKAVKEFGCDKSELHEKMHKIIKDFGFKNFFSN